MSEVLQWDAEGSDTGDLDALDTANEFEDTEAFASLITQTKRPEIAPLDPHILSKIDPLIAGDNKQVAEAILSMSGDDRVNSTWLGWLADRTKRTLDDYSPDFLKTVWERFTAQGARIDALERLAQDNSNNVSQKQMQQALDRIHTLEQELDNKELRITQLEDQVTTMVRLHKDAYAGMVAIYNEYRDTHTVVADDEKDRLRAEVDRLVLQLAAASGSSSTTTTQQVRPAAASATSTTYVRIDTRPATTWLQLRTKYRPALTPADAMSRFTSGER